MYSQEQEEEEDEEEELLEEVLEEVHEEGWIDELMDNLAATRDDGHELHADTDVADPCHDTHDIVADLVYEPVYEPLEVEPRRLERRWLILHYVRHPYP